MVILLVMLVLDGEEIDDGETVIVETVVSLT